MSEDMRKMIDKVKNFKQFVNENISKELDVDLREYAKQFVLDEYYTDFEQEEALENVYNFIDSDFPYGLQNLPNKVLLYRILDVNVKDLKPNNIGQHFVGDKNLLFNSDFLNSIEFIDKTELPHKIKENGIIVTVEVNKDDIDLYETIRTKGNYLSEFEYTVRSLNYIIKNIENVKLK
jgi:hypothetical protein